MQAIYAILDIPKGMGAIARRCWGLNPGGSLFLFVALLGALFPFLYLFWTYDLMSTWNWTSFVGIREADTQPFRDGVANALDVQDAGVVLSIIIWSFALLPTLVEVAFGRLIDQRAPGIAIILNICIAFDFVTDIPSIWNIIHNGALQANGTRGAAWFASWGIARYLPQAACATLFTFLVSVVIQVIVVYIVTALIVLAGNIITAGARGAITGDIKVLTGDGQEISVKKRLTA